MSKIRGHATPKKLSIKASIPFCIPVLRRRAERKTLLSSKTKQKKSKMEHIAQLTWVGAPMLSTFQVLPNCMSLRLMPSPILELKPSSIFLMA